MLSAISNLLSRCVISRTSDDKGSSKLMWKSSLRDTKLHHFMQTINKKFSTRIENYRQLWEWSVKNYSDFWKEVWLFCEIVHSQSFSTIVDLSLGISDIPKWFADAQLNYAENLLRYRDEKIAVISTGEGQEPRRITYCELHNQVALYASALRNVGIKTGDRVVGYVPNCIEALIAMLAVASIGAIWSSTSPDFGVTGVLDRFQQIEPKLIFSVNAVFYNGKVHSHLDKLKQVVLGLQALDHVVVIPFVKTSNCLSNIDDIPKSAMLSSFLENGCTTDKLRFEQLPFNHPLFIMYSSGTTGPPKCMVHSAGGTLLQTAKEHHLHGNMNREDVMIYYTTTGWMMWNWLVGALTTGASIVLYDGSPFQPTATLMWDLVDLFRITIVGTSAKCLAVMEEKGVATRDTHSLTSLHTILSTGSPLAPHQYDYVYHKIKPNLLLGSITGGTDIISCFAGQNWMLPVYRGEIQAANLGMAICCYDEVSGKPVLDRSGELVCTKPFPSMPTRFWNDPDGTKYKNAYFTKFPGVWAHGDFCIENSMTHGLVMLGRSDATLNPSGVRIGTAEIYSVVEKMFGDEISDSLAVAHRKSCGEGAFEERVVLFLVMTPGHCLDDELKARLRSAIRVQLSPRHVPAVVATIADIPYTISGKKVEVAVTRILAGLEVSQRGSFRNPEALDLYKNLTCL